MIAPFLMRKYGWVSSDTCWWCSKGRQTREHLFKECLAWKQEIRELWKEVKEATRVQGVQCLGGTVYKGRKGFLLGTMRQEGGRPGRSRGSRGPGNTSIGDLMADERCIPAIISFHKKTKCGQVKEGVIMRQRNSSG